MSSTRIAPAYPTIENIDGDGVVNFNGEDIIDRNRQTLRSYLRSITLGEAPNSNNDAVIEYNGQLPPNHGNAFPLNSSPDIRQTGFTDQPGLSNAVSLDQEPSEIFGDVERIVDQGELGKANSDVALTGHELLAGVIGSEVSNGSVKTSTTGAKRYVETLGSSLKKKNLNVGSLKVTDTETGSTTNIIKDYEFTGESSGTRKTIERIKLGDTLSGVTSTSFDVNDPKFIDEKDMKKVATFLLDQAMGNKQVQSGKSLVKNSSSKIRPARAPGFQNFNRTTLSDGEDSIPSGETEGGRYTDVSWGQHYSPNEKYTGSATGRQMFIAVAGSTAIIVGLVALLSAFIPKIKTSEIPAEVNSGLNQARKLISGEFKYEPLGGFGAFISRALNVASNVTGLDVSNPFYIPTNPWTGYGDCVIAGLASFLGVSYEIDGRIIFPLGFLQFNLNTAIIFGEIAVRYATLLIDNNQRQYYARIFRLLNQDLIALKQRADDVGDASGFRDTASEAFDFLESLFDSRLFAFINTLAKVGDLAYKQAAARSYRGTDVEVSPEASYDQETDNVYVDMLKRGFAATRIKGNKLTGRRGVTYAASDLPSNYLIPRGSSQIYEGLIGNIGVAKRIKSQKHSGANKFTPEEVAKVESILEAEYMPFYFQDLRTNEIIAFHAFLEDLSDSYSANYNSTNAYGRVDEIKTYKDTKRSVGLTFQLVSTNPSDFDYIWWQINKLTTMVYPQWSRGRQLQADVGGTNLNFTQPFSQIPTASPLIRVRVGDLIRSNYSRFNLKRLFGFQDIDVNQNNNSKVIEEYVLPVGSKIIWGNFEEDRTLAEELIVKNPKWNKDAGTFIVNPTSLSVKTIENSVQLLPLNIEVYPSDLGKSKRTTNVNESLNLFYNPTENSIIRSFETTQGQGLAAVITQLQFTWMDGLWGVGEDGPGNRAPRSCKIQMSFDPIHDIAPGLDSDGFNRAPIYPVGNIVNGLVEGGEDQPYGVGTSSKNTLNNTIAFDKIVYETANEPSVLKKLF